MVLSASWFPGPTFLIGSIETPPPLAFSYPPSPSSWAAAPRRRCLTHQCLPGLWHYLQADDPTHIVGLVPPRSLQDPGTLSPRLQTFGHREPIVQPQLPQRTLHPQHGRAHHLRRPQLKCTCNPGPWSLPQTQRRSSPPSLLAILTANHPAASVERATTLSSSWLTRGAKATSTTRHRGGASAS